MSTLLRTHVLSRFTCLGDRCEDTCCKGWSMQVDEHTIAQYHTRAPELMEAVETSKEAPWIMKKDPASSYCVKLEDGLCGIHKNYGEQLLGDACHFYPRVTRILGEQRVMTATMSCPEIARLALADDYPILLEAVDVERVPFTLKEYLPVGLTAAEALEVHHAFLRATEDNDANAELILLRLNSVSRSLELIDRKSWPQAVPFYLKHADQRAPLPESNISDPFNLLHALCGLIVASHKRPSPRLLQTISEMEQALHVTLDWEKVEIHTNDDSLAAWLALDALWQETVGAFYAPLLRRWLKMQLSLALYPFAGLGESLSERVTIIGVRLATFKLALMCCAGVYGFEIPQDVVLRSLQSLSRFLDHLGDPGFSLTIYTETGWVHEARMRGLLNI